MKAALLWYQKFARNAQDYGFELNPYDPCVANKTIEGTQATLVWHVDDTKMSHKKRKVVNSLISWLKTSYETIWSDGSGKMTVNRGKAHDYLGMVLDFGTEGSV